MNSFGFQIPHFAHSLRRAGEPTYFQQSSGRLCEYSSFLIKAWIDVNALSNGNPECTWDRSPYEGEKKQNKTRVWASATPMIHVGWGNQCLDLDVMTCLCCKWLECNRAWPVKLACSQWLALCSLLCLGASLPDVSCHWDQGEAQMFPAALPNLIVSLPVFM